MPKVHYNALSGAGKFRKSSQRRVRRDPEKGSESTERENRQDSRSKNVSYAAGPFRVRNGMAPTIFPLSPLLAHTSTRERCKSFISTHIAKRGGVGYDFFQKWVIGSAGAWWLRVRKQRTWGDGRYYVPGFRDKRVKVQLLRKTSCLSPGEGRGGHITGRLSRR